MVRQSRAPVWMPAIGALALSLLVSVSAEAQLTEPFDHLHLSVTDVQRAHAWYIEHMGGNAGETPESVSWGAWPADHPLPIQIFFTLSEGARPSAGSAIDHIGFSFADVGAKLETLRAAGVKVVSPVADIPGRWRQAVVEDPWGTKLVLVEDPDALGIHHVEIRVPDPDESLRWYVWAFGGDRTKYKGTIDAVRYREFGVFFLFAVKDEKAEPSPGHTIDHLGFGPIDLDKVVNALKAEGVTLLSDPNPRLNPACRFLGADGESGGFRLRRLYCAQPDQLAHRVVQLEAPGGVRVELLQHLEAGGH